MLRLLCARVCCMQAALKLSLLQQQRAALAKEIKWISKQDV